MPRFSRKDLDRFDRQTRSYVKPRKNLGHTSSGKIIPDITNKAYTTHSSAPKWNKAVTSLDEPKLLKRHMPSWTRQDHAEAAEAHHQAKERVEAQHARFLDDMYDKYGGDRWRFVAGGHQEHWPENVKDKSRDLAIRATKHAYAERAHETAMRFRNR